TRWPRDWSSDVCSSDLVCLVGLTGVRLALRTFRESVTVSSQRSGRQRRRVGIIGAGDAGAVLAHELTLKRGYGLVPVAFFDDDRSEERRVGKRVGVGVR